VSSGPSIRAVARWIASGTGGVDNQMAARHLHGPARRRPQRGSAAIARPVMGSDPAACRSGARVVITQLPGQEARRAGQAAHCAADHGRGRGIRQHTRHDLRLYPATGGRPRSPPWRSPSCGPPRTCVRKRPRPPTRHPTRRSSATWPPTAPRGCAASRSASPATGRSHCPRAAALATCAPHCANSSPHRTGACSSGRSPSNAGSTSIRGSTQPSRLRPQVARK
jgi:hypothetical protein